MEKSKQVDLHGPVGLFVGRPRYKVRLFYGTIIIVAKNVHRLPHS